MPKTRLMLRIDTDLLAKLDAHAPPGQRTAVIEAAITAYLLEHSRAAHPLAQPAPPVATTTARRPAQPRPAPTRAVVTPRFGGKISPS